MVVASSTADSSQTDPVGVHGTFVSIGFWICLLVAAAGYAAATLSSEYVEHQRLAARFRSGQRQVRRLADQVDRYERYCRRLARRHPTPQASTTPARAMPVDDALRFRLDDSPPVQVDPANVVVPRIIEVMSRSQTLRRTTIAAAAVLIVFGFTMLVEPSRPDPPPRCERGETVDGRSFNRRLSRWGARYRTVQRSDVA